jgi:hypothetical protein
MIVQIDKDRFNSLMSDAVAFNHVIGSLVFTEVVKLGKTIAICIGEGESQQFLEQK